MQYESCSVPLSHLDFGNIIGKLMELPQWPVPLEYIEGEIKTLRPGGWWRVGWGREGRRKWHTFRIPPLIYINPRSSYSFILHTTTITLCPILGAFSCVLFSHYLCDHFVCYQLMATAPPNPPRNQNVTLPPKRGRVKAQIFESLAGTVSYVASKARQALAKIGGGGGGGSSDSSTSTSTTTSPPPSAYASDGYGDPA
ncbi:hypothetical protein Pfo_018148 [Paulownia fortunei]|nr:hypothetical protein Pfo_018148 [Paulownia fortunei]